MTFASGGWSTKWHLCFVLLLAMGGLNGCATRESGYKITKQTTAFVQPGTTSRSDIIENLGPPLLELKSPQVMAYSWGKVRISGGGRLAPPETVQSSQMGYTPPPPSPMDEASQVEARRWIYCIALDGQNLVTRAETIRLQGEPSLESAIRRWAGSESGKQP